MRRRITLLLALTIAVLGLGALPAVAGGPNHVVQATTSGEGKVDVRSGLQAAPTGTDDLTSANVAQAHSRDCTGCRTIAVALQAVLVTGNPSNASPENVAIALNERCTSCTTYAFAFQYVVSTGGPAHLSPAGERAVADLRREAAAIAHSDAPLADIDARLQNLGARLKSTVDAEIVRTGGSPSGGTVRERTDGFAG
jgi:hypothetical protein